MIKKATIIFLLCSAFPALMFGQGETSNWYFGNGAGISFKGNGTIEVKNDSQINTAEGCATISDSFGNLLFYTDGITVYDKDHQIMENGTGLYGNPSSTQSAIIVPQPGSTQLFYVFTADTGSSKEETVDNGLNYSTINMALNGGKGAVVEKNVSLLAHSSEKLAAIVKNCIEQSIWLVTLASSSGEKKAFDTYHAFEISTAGVSGTSVKSTFADLAINDPRGYLKINSNGTQIASANMADGLFLYDFHLETGMLSHQRKLSISGSKKAPYGIEFSPNGRFLYVHASKDALEGLTHASTLLQYDLETSNISSSQVVLDDRPIFRGALQVGENGKIYRTIAKNFDEGTPFLGVINIPNEKGEAARYKHDAISLGTNTAMQGLPPFVQSFLNKTDLLTVENGKKVSVLTLCQGEDVKLEAELIEGATYSWKKDGIPFSNPNGNYVQITGASNQDAGRYQLQINLNDPMECPIVGEALIEVSPLPESENFIWTQCEIISEDDPASGHALFNLDQLSEDEGDTFLFYESAQDRRDDIEITNAGNYRNTIPYEQTIFYTARNEAGCKGYGEITLQVSPTPLNESVLSPFLGCATSSGPLVSEGTFDLEFLALKGYPGLEVNFYSNLTDLTLEENVLDDIITREDTLIYARVEADNQCLGVEKIRLRVMAKPRLEFLDTITVCTDGIPSLLEAPPGFDSYAWYKNEGGQWEKIGETDKLSLFDDGNYRLEVGRSHELEGQTMSCVTTKDFEALPSNRAIFAEIRIEDIAQNNRIEVLASGDGDYEYSLNGVDYQDSGGFENVQPGFYSLFARDKNGCGITEEEIAVMGFPTFFTPNGDGFNDEWHLIGVDPDEISARISIFDRLGQLMAQLESNDPGWDGTYQGRHLPASDYWFRVNFEDGKEYTGHFSLKR